MFSLLLTLDGSNQQYLGTECFSTRFIHQQNVTVQISIKQCIFIINCIFKPYPMTVILLFCFHSFLTYRKRNSYPSPVFCLISSRYSYTNSVDSPEFLRKSHLNYTSFILRSPIFFSSRKTDGLIVHTLYHY